MIKDKACEMIDAKYKSGQLKHGDNLWERDIEKDEEDEIIDLMVYRATKLINKQLNDKIE